MTRVLRTQSFSVPAADVWRVIGGFNALTDWHPAVASSSLEPCGEVIRRLTLHGMDVSITEKLVRLDDAARTYSYTIEESPLPVSGYLATLVVLEEPGGCVVRWSSEFSPVGIGDAEAEALVGGIYEAGFERLREIFTS